MHKMLFTIPVQATRLSVVWPKKIFCRAGQIERDHSLYSSTSCSHSLNGSKLQ